ncbi:unnamed protein product [Macrosiphum euphorbiae]|uniref:DUF659 domain-containing protein n=1 Tax=Macrosiphum euphorbiae TaxID=13131 RepID=A0AAV0Y069_9HEMI|nr:unnamed protein product [Macrosiphum euphorbiae]
MANKLLDDEYKQMTIKVHKKVNEAFVYGIQMDGWSNTRNEPIINIIITTPEPVVYKSLSTTVYYTVHTAEYVANELNLVIDVIGKSRCF